MSKMVRVGGLIATPYGGNGNGAPTPEEEAVAAACGCSVNEMRRIATASMHYMRSALKGGNINQGYAQCDVDQLALMVAKGECAAERITCRNEAGLRATAVAAGASVTHTITPVGPAFLREILTVLTVDDDPMAPGSEFWVTQIAGAGRFAVTGNVTSSGTGQPANGAFPLNAHARSFQNYVASSGIMFDASTPLAITIANIGTQDGSYTVDVTYDLIRAG